MICKHNNLSKNNDSSYFCVHCGHNFVVRDADTIYTNKVNDKG